uniref:transposase n=1 Tax=Rhizobium sp. T1473 TaxID=555321 RepID=UPI00403F7072
MAEADLPGVRIGDVARRHDIYPAQIRLWRKALSHFDASAPSLPVHLVDEVRLGQTPPARATPVLIKILLRNGRRLVG